MLGVDASVELPMPTSVFVSYSRPESDWVWERLVPVLEAAGAEVLIDREQFGAARAVYRQMDKVQDRAELNLLVLSPDYLASRACQHEMRRAIARDPTFEMGVTIPVLRKKCQLPPEIKRPDPLYVDLRDASKPEPWDLLLEKCKLDLGATAPEWLRARDRIVRHLERGESVNLVVSGRVRWLPLLDQLRNNSAVRLGIVRLDSKKTEDRPLLVREILEQCGCPPPDPDPDKPIDLVVLGRTLKALPRAPRLALTSFDIVTERMAEYEPDFFVALRDLMMDARKLILLITSHAPFATLLPKDHPLSVIDIKTVELKGRP
jgi:hypothetical protein